MEASSDLEVRGMECPDETVRGLEASNLGCSDEGYVGGCEMSGHDARAMDSEKMSTEESMGQSRQYNGFNWKQLRKEDIIGLEFKTIELAEEYYVSYATAIGFSVRKDTLYYNKKGEVARRRWCCSKAGVREEKYNDLPNRIKPARRLTRENCPAFFVVNYDNKSEVYVVKNFEPDHSHELATPCESPYLRSNRVVSKSDLAQAMAMRRVLVRTSHTYEYMVDQSGGYLNVGFQIKDLYNKLDASRREILLDGDTEAALAYMKAKASVDPEYFCKFSVDEENRLGNLFWRDSTSLMDYVAFGDVLIFDSTYKTNMYDKPLVLFVGSNNHRASVIFGCALLLDETFETYKWLLETFISSMKGKKPTSILTDGDEAMRKAIEYVLPMCNHRLCSWHVARNAQNNLKDEELVRSFQACLWEPIAVNEFEKKWEFLKERVTTHKQKEWLEMMYAKRDAWAESRLRPKFFGGMCTTQRVECMNKFVKDYLRKGVKLFECIPAIDRAMARMRNTSGKDDFEAKQSKEVLTTTLKSLEQHASQTYTHKCFLLVRNEINASSALIHEKIIHNFGGRLYILAKYGEPQSNWSCVYHGGEDVRIECNCQKYESEGIPCCHLFYVMKWEHVMEIPSSLIMKRWTKSARIDIGYAFLSESGSKEVEQTARYGSLSCIANRVCLYASKSRDGYGLLKNELSRLEGIVHGLWQKEDETTLNLGSCGQFPPNIVKDPTLARTKGTQGRGSGTRKQRQCMLCRRHGHTKRTCSKRNIHPSANEVVNLSSGSQRYQYSNNIGPSPDISYSYASQTVSQSTSNDFANYTGNDVESTASPSGSTQQSDGGFSFGTHEPIQLSSDAIYSSQSYGSLFTWRNEH